ncbi:hypothetical protein ACMSI6_26375 [Pseudomonas antarctica]|uniref:hypothetical protein n=1 Tax=Pseudomonas antarctica TaxID=219572 RepID=UPI0039C123E8
MDRLERLNELLREHDCVIAIDIQFEDFKYDLALTLSVDTTDWNAVTIHFQDVSALNLSEFGGGITQFMRLNVTRINDGLDRIRYELRDVRHEKVTFKFFTFGGPMFDEAAYEA